MDKCRICRVEFSEHEHVTRGSNRFICNICEFHPLIKNLYPNFDRSCYECGVIFCRFNPQGPKNDYGYLCWDCVLQGYMINENLSITSEEVQCKPRYWFWPPSWFN